MLVFIHDNKCTKKKVLLKDRTTLLLHKCHGKLYYLKLVTKIYQAKNIMLPLKKYYKLKTNFSKYWEHWLAYKHLGLEKN